MTDHEREELIARVSRATEVPDPSPLFWEHFPGRVRSAIQAAPTGTSRAWPRRAWLLVAFPIVVGFVLALSLFPRGTVSAPGQEPAVLHTAADDRVQDMESLDADSGWAVVSSVAASAGAEVLRDAGFGVSPGGAESAIELLTEVERAELVALLEAEMKRDAPGGL